MATIFRKNGKQIWWVSYYHNGKRYRYSLRTADERIARKKLKKLEGELVTNELETKSRTPVGPFLEAFSGHLLATRTHKSYKNDISYLRIFFGPVCKALQPKTSHNRHHRSAITGNASDRFRGRHVSVKLLEEVTPNVISTFINTRITRDGISPKTANRMREVLHVMFNYAIRQCQFNATEKRYPNPVDAVPRYREEQSVIRFLTLDQIDQQLKVLKVNPTLHAMVATLIYTGVRREELLWLTKEDVDLDSHMIRVCKKTVDGATWWPKTRRNRRVPISSMLQGYLNSFRPRQRPPWFFSSPKGYRWDPDNFSQVLRKINRQHGYPWGCLDYRHTFGSHLAMKGESLFKISELMGNSPEICRRHYAALVPEKMRDTVEFDARPHRGHLKLR